jgi:hypothetical protein
MNPLNLEQCDPATLAEAKADGVICFDCAQPHDKIIKQIEMGATEIEMESVGHTWLCAECRTKKRYH